SLETVMVNWVYGPGRMVPRQVFQSVHACWFDAPMVNMAVQVTAGGIWPHTPLLQNGLFCGQTTPQLLQLFGSAVRLASQPSFGSLLQLAKPITHWPGWQVPAA